MALWTVDTKEVILKNVLRSGDITIRTEPNLLTGDTCTVLSSEIFGEKWYSMATNSTFTTSKENTANITRESIRQAVEFLKEKEKELAYDHAYRYNEYLTTATSSTVPIWTSATATTASTIHDSLYNWDNTWKVITATNAGHSIEVGCYKDYLASIQRFEWPQETVDERFDREWREMLRTKQRNNEKLSKERAKNRALELLLRNLSDEQLKRFNEDKCIPVDGPSGNKYLIRPARSINIEVVGKHHKLCAGIESGIDVPIYDAMLAQKLLLEGDERRFLEIANVHR